jgi:hypothetical protein
MKSQFISDYLTHWTGRGDRGFDNLRSILSNNQLWLTRCVHYKPSEWQEANLKMVCFTDIPHYLSKEHCAIYGDFGIVFNKAALIGYGANPVLYVTDVKREDINRIYRYICDANTGRTQLDADVLESLKRLFGFVQQYQDEGYAYYYEREWRILKNNLPYSDSTDVTSGQCGSFVGENGDRQYYFQFKSTDVAFLICPKDYFNRLAQAHAAHPVLTYEYLVL